MRDATIVGTPETERTRPVPPTGLVCLGVIAGARGLKGEVWVRSFTARAEDVCAYGPLVDDSGRRTLHIQLTGQLTGHLTGAAGGRGRPGLSAHPGLSARIEGIDDRTAAEALSGTRLFVPRAALPAPAEDEFYHVDLIGLRADVRGPDGDADRPWGRVRDVHDFGAGTVLEIAGDDGGSVMVGFTRAAVPEVDLAAGRLVLAEPPVEPVVVTAAAGAESAA